MRTKRICRRLTQGGLVLLLLICTPGCATTGNQPQAVEYQGPIEEPKKKSTFWSVLGFILTPIANFLTSKDEPHP